MRSLRAFFGFAALLLFTIHPRLGHAVWNSDPSVNNTVCDTTASKECLTSIGDGNGGVFYVWMDHRPTPGFPSDNLSLFAQHLDAEGNALWPLPGLAVCQAFGVQSTPVLLLDNQGGIYIIWYDERTSSAQADIYGQHLRADGTLVGGWATDGNPVSLAFGSYPFPQIVPDGSGGAIAIISESTRNANKGIDTRKIASGGTVTPDPNLIATEVVPSDDVRDIDFMTAAPDGSGGAWIAWRQFVDAPNQYGIYVTRITSAGTRAVGMLTSGTVIAEGFAVLGPPQIASDGSGGAIVSWVDGVTQILYAKRIDSSAATVAGWNDNGTTISTGPVNPVRPEIVVDATNGVYFAWDDLRAFNSVPRLALFTAGGQLAGGWTVNGDVATPTAVDRYPTKPLLRPDGAGGVFITWLDIRNDDNHRILYAQRFGSNGVHDPAWPVDGRIICDDHMFPLLANNDGYNYDVHTVVTAPAHSIIAGWRDFRNGTNPDLFFRSFEQTVFASRVPLTTATCGLVVNDFATSDIQPSGSSSGFSFAGEQDITSSYLSFDGADGSYRANVLPDPQRFRVTGLQFNRSEWLPYQNVGSQNYVRGKFWVYSGNQVTTYSAEVPNFRMRVANRFALNSMLEILQQQSRFDPTNTTFSEELRPSDLATTPSVYRVDYDPVDVPYLQTNGSVEGIMRLFEAYALDPEDNGYVALTESMLCTYPASALPDYANPEKVYAPTASDAGGLAVTNSSTELFNSVLILSTSVGGFPVEDTTTTLRPTYIEGSFGVTLDTTQVAANRVGVITREFQPGLNLASRLRVEPGVTYKTRFHVTSTQASNLNAQVRLRTRAIKFAWTHKFEIGGAWGTGGAGLNANNSIAQQALPGVGCLNPDKIASEKGGWYTMITNSPIDPDIRANQPNILAAPGTGVNAASVRDFRTAAEIVDSASNGANTALEQGNCTIDRIEVRIYPRVDD